MYYTYDSVFCNGNALVMVDYIVAGKPLDFAQEAKNDSSFRSFLNLKYINGDKAFSYKFKKNIIFF